MKTTYAQLAGACVLLIAAGIAYMVGYGGVSGESGQLASVEAQIQDRSQSTTRIAQERQQLNSLMPEINEVNQYFISTNNIVTFLEQLASTGKFLGTTVQVASVSATTGSPTGTLNLALTITGPFDAVMRTLGSIEYGPYDLQTVSVTLNENGSGKSATWQATGTFTIGMQSGPQATGTSVPASSTPLTVPVAPTTPAASTTSSAPSLTP